MEEKDDGNEKERRIKRGEREGREEATGNEKGNWGKPEGSEKTKGGEELRRELNGS